MSQHHQNGHLRRARRRIGPQVWEYLWRETDVNGRRVHRTALIGTLEQYPTQELAWAAANGLRMHINSNRNRYPDTPIPLKDLIDHYVYTDLSSEDSWHSHATRMVYRHFLRKWILPAWGNVALHSVRTLAVEHWLRGLKRMDGRPLADATKGKIRNILSVLFNHAIRCEWLEQGRNPITFVRQSAKRNTIPVVLEPHEVQALLLQLKPCFRLMVELAVTTGLRRSELCALRWSDVNFSDLVISIQRSIFNGVTGSCKTESSRKALPLDERVAADLWLWKQATQFTNPEDWIFASPRKGGSEPYWPGTVLAKIVQPAARRAGIQKKVGWHTFRHTYSTLLVANGENLKVVQELMRHARASTTLDLYTQARLIAKRQAQQRIVECLFAEGSESIPPAIRGDRAIRHLAWNDEFSG
jgi:integrase